MDFTKLTDMVRQSQLPFVYSNERLNEENCQKVLQKVGASTDVLAVIASNYSYLVDGLVISKNGIKFSLSDGSVGDKKIPKRKGEYLFNDYIIHDISVSEKNDVVSLFNFSMLIWDKIKQKSFTFQFGLVQDKLKLNESMTEELTAILKCLITKTGTEFISPDLNTDERNPNEFNFVFGNLFHTIITVDDNDIIIKKYKIDEKSKIQTPMEEPITIKKTAIESIAKVNVFSFKTLIIRVGIGIVLSIILWSIFKEFWSGFIALVISITIGIISAIGKPLVIKRKDGTKYSMGVSGSDENNKEYERFINVIFK